MTSSKPLKFEKKSRDRETIFLNHYNWLLDWARQHTQGASEEAEDLVQDLYVRFVQMKSGPSFTDDDQVRAYLYTSLKNLFISRKLRSGRDAVSGLLAVDFDSVEFAVSAVDRSQLLHVRSDLAGICEYACIRRKTSRAASALILRFFLGYLPTEVMALLRTKRSNIDTLIENARLEAKAYLNRPGVLRFLGRGERKPASSPRYLPEEPEALFAELQRRIFSEPQGACPPPGELRERYLRPDAPAFTTQEIAHLASCSICMNLAIGVLGLPDLILRFGSESDSPEGTDPPSIDAGAQGLKKLRRKLRETYEHRPKKLQIAVDGEIRGVQTITSASSHFQIALPPLSQPAFVEVLSEQGLGLLYFDLQQGTLEMPAPRTAAVDLSDGRQLSVSLSLAGGAPVIDVTYYDPLLEMDAEDPLSAQAPVSDPFNTGSREILQAEPDAPPKSARWPSRFVFSLGRQRPLTIAIALAVCVLIGLVTVDIHRPREAKPPATAASILAQSKARTTAAIPPHGAVHEIFSLEVRSGQGTLIGTADVDLLRSADRPLESLRLRGSNGDVLASRWIDAQGKVRDFSKMERSKSGNAAPAIGLQSTAWQHPPDAADFERLAGGENELTLQEAQDGYDVSFRRPETSGKTSVVAGRLVIAAASMRPVAESLRVRDGDGIREYRFKILRYEVLRSSQLRASDFAPDSYSYHARHGRNTMGEARLTLEALQVLSAQSEEIRSAVDLERSPEGGILIAGVVPTLRQAQSLVRLLRRLPGGGALRLELHSADEPLGSRQVSWIGSVSPISVATGRAIPLDGMLRASLRARSGTSGAALDEQVRQEAREIIGRSARMDRAAWVASQIGSRDFRASELAAMSARDRRIWLTLLAQPLVTCDADLNAIAATLGASKDSVPPAQHRQYPIRTVRELALSADDLRQNAGRLDRLLMTGFALSPDNRSPSVSPAELFDQLTRVQREEMQLRLTVQSLERAAPANRNE